MNTKLTAEQLNNSSKKELITLLEKMQKNLDQEREQNQKFAKTINVLHGASI